MPGPHHERARVRLLIGVFEERANGRELLAERESRGEILQRGLALLEPLRDVNIRRGGHEVMQLVAPAFAAFADAVGATALPGLLAPLLECRNDLLHAYPPPGRPCALLDALFFDQTAKT